MKDYSYICQHPEEYEKEYAAAKEYVNGIVKFVDTSKYSQLIIDGIIQKCINMRFHYSLIEKGRESLPQRCLGCPMLSCESIHNGMIRTICDLNTHVLVGDLFFGWRLDKRPEWCPLNDIEVKT